MKKLTEKGIQQITLHEAFITMLYSSIHDNSKFDTLDILEYWFEIAFGKYLTEEDLNAQLIDRIRIQLLIKGGINKPILKETIRIYELKNTIVFDD